MLFEMLFTTLKPMTLQPFVHLRLCSLWDENKKAMGIKMVLSGEGADEIFGGYLYFHKAPNAQEFHEETVRKRR